MYITASQFAWRSASSGSWACQSRELLQAAAVNKGLVLGDFAGLREGKKTICLVSARGDR